MEETTTVTGVKRRAALVAACELIPVPLLDTVAQNRVRRDLVRTVARQRGLELAEEQVRALADEPLRPVTRVLLWPLKKLFGTVFMVVGAVYLAKTAHDAHALGRSIGADDLDG